MRQSNIVMTNGKKDMRTSFCKRNKKYETTDCILISITKEYIDRGEARIIGDRLFLEME